MARRRSSDRGWRPPLSHPLLAAHTARAVAVLPTGNSGGIPASSTLQCVPRPPHHAPRIVTPPPSLVHGFHGRAGGGLEAARGDTGCGGGVGGEARRGCRTTSRSASGTGGGGARGPNWAWRRSPPRAECHRRATRGPVSLLFCTDPAIGPFLQSPHRRGGVERGGGAGAPVGAATRAVRGVRRWQTRRSGGCAVLARPPAPPPTPPNGHDEGRVGREACGERAEWKGWTGAPGGNRSQTAPRGRAAVAAPGGARALAAVAVWGNGVGRRRGCRAPKATPPALHLRRPLPLGGTDSAHRAQKHLVGDQLRSDAPVLSWSSTSSPRLISSAMGPEDRQNGCCGGAGGPSCAYCTRLGFPDSQRGVAGELRAALAQRAAARVDGERGQTTPCASADEGDVARALG